MNQIRTPRDRLDRVLTILWRSRRFFLQAMALLLAGGAVSVTYAMLRKRVFKSETLILYREGIRPSDIGAGDEPVDRAHKLGLRLKEMVHSRTRLEAIIGQYKLYPQLVEERGIIEAVDEMRNHISFRVKDGDTFGLAFDGDDPKQVQKVTARLADALIAEQSKSTSDQATINKQFLDQELTQAEAVLRDKELAQAQFLGKHPEFAKEAALQGGGNQAGIAIRAQAAAKQQGGRPVDPVLASLEREAERLQQRLGMPVARRKRDVEGDPTLVANKQDAEADVRQLQKDLQQKLGEYTESHPDVIAARIRLKMAQDKLKRATDALSANIAAAQQRSAIKEEDEGTIDRSALEGELRRVNAEIVAFKQKKGGAQAAPTAVNSSVVELEMEWTRLNREVAKAREDYATLQDRQFKAAMVTTAAASGNTAQMLIVDPAFVPTHAAKPSRSAVAGAGIAVSLLLAIALAIGLAMVDDRLYDRVDVERLGLLPLVGMVPRPSKSDENRGQRG